MRKITLIAMLLGVVMLAGCTGDDPAGPGGTLADVTGFAIDENASGGTTVILNWTAVSSNGPDAIDGYKLYFNETDTFVEGDIIATIPTGNTTYSHAASSAGYYGIIAYEGDDTSAEYARDNDMPIFFTTTKTIWDNHAPAQEHSGFVFDANGGHTCLAGQGGLDIYCYDGDWSQSPVGFYSGDLAPFGDGNATTMWAADGSVVAYPTGNSFNNGYILAGDIIFCELSNGHFTKVYVTAIPQHSVQPASHGITFSYDWQPIEGLELFTTATS